MKPLSYLNRPAILALSAIVIVLGLGSGCAYYNTFYNIKQEFRAAEKETQRAMAGNIAQPATGEPGHPGPSGQPGQNLGPIQQYQTIIQSCGKLLEFYPKSRWVDDALMVMGISYFRIQEFARAERKFTELVTIFPKSKHAEMAIVWRARALVAQNKLDEAENVLINDEAKLISPSAKAASMRTLAELSDVRQQPEEAISYLEQIRDISYNKDEKATDFLRLGRSYILLNRNDDAKAALQRCLDLTRVPAEAFQARKILAEISTAQNNYLEAKNYLLPMRTDRRFLEQAGDVEVELARVEAHAGDPIVAIQMLKQYCASAVSGENKARAYFLQGEVARNRLGDYQLAKAKFDSVAAAGASRVLQDSARQASAQLESGLNALSRIPALTDSLRHLVDNPPAIEPEVEKEEIIQPADESLSKDVAPSLDSMAVDSVVEFEEPDSMMAVAPDSTTEDSTNDVVETIDDAATHEPVAAMSPAELIADSIMRSLLSQDSIRRAEQAKVEKLAEAEVAPNAHPEPVAVRAPSAQEQHLERVRMLSRKLVSAHLEAASFFELVALNQDSALAHLESAVAVLDSSDEHWRAIAQLGFILLQKDEASSSRGRQLLEEVAGADDAPFGLRNTTCRKLGLPELEATETEQTRSLKRAESMLLSDNNIEDVLSAYQETVSMDSMSHEGCRALHALAYLQEYRARDFEAARTSHEAIVRLFPDSTFTALSRAKLAAPDSNSVFLMSDEALEASYQPASEMLSAESDSTGWPPDVETLRGRRFR